MDEKDIRELSELEATAGWVNLLRRARTIAQLTDVIDMVPTWELRKQQILAQVRTYMRMGEERNGHADEEGAVALTIAAMLAKPGYLWGGTPPDPNAQRVRIRMPNPLSDPNPLI